MNGGILMNTIYNQTSGKKIITENQIRAVLLLHFSQSEDTDILEDFIKNYDVTLEEMQNLLDWLNKNEIDISKYEITNECILILIGRDISDGKLDLNRINKYINYFWMHSPSEIITIYKYLEDNDCSIDLMNDHSYPLKDGLNEYKRLTVTLIEQFEQKYPIYENDSYLYDGFCDGFVFEDDIESFTKKLSLSTLQTNELIKNYEENEDIDLIDNKKEYIKELIDNLSFDSVIDRKDYYELINKFVLTFPEKKYYHNYLQSNYRLIDLKAMLMNLRSKIEYLNTIFGFDFPTNQLTIKETVQKIYTTYFPSQEYTIDEIVESVDSSISIKYYSQLVITRLICLEVERIAKKSIGDDYIEDLASDFNLYDSEYENFKQIFYIDEKDMDEDGMYKDYFELTNNGCSSLYNLCIYIMKYLKVQSDLSMDDIVLSFKKNYSSISLQDFCDVFPSIIRIAKKEKNANEGKIDTFIDSLVNSIETILLTIE